MSVQFEKTLNHAFVFNEERLGRIAKTLEGEFGEMNIRVKCLDDGVRTFESIDDLLSYENHKDRRILSIVLYAKNTNDNIEEIRVSLQQNAVWLTVKGSDPHASQCKDDLCDILTGAKPWYWWLSDKDFGFFFGLFLVCYWILVIYANWEGTASTDQGNISITKTVVATIIVSIAGLSFAWTMARVRRVSFPFSQFLIGQEKQRASLQEWMRKLIVGTVVMVFVGGILRTLGF